MNILFVNFGFLPAVHWGGPVKIVYQNAKELQRRGHQVSICASNLFDKHRRVASGCFQRRVDGLPVTYLNTYTFSHWPGTLGPSLLSPRARCLLSELAAEQDLVHVNGIRHALAFAAVRAANHHGKAVVLQLHGTLPHIVSSIWLKKAFDRLFLGNLLAASDIFIAGQQAEARQITAAGGERPKIRIVPNGLATDIGNGSKSPEDFRATYGLTDNEQIILFLGRINHKKGTDLLVEAYAKLPEETRNRGRLVIAGPDDGQLAQLHSLVHHHNLEEQVVFTGLLEGSSVDCAYAAADIFVLPCRTDTFPMAIIEACQAGTPMVVSDSCEIADILDGRAASVVPPAPEPLAAAMHQLLTDQILQTRYRRGAAELLGSIFSMAAVGDRLETVYAEAVENRRRRAI